MGLTRQSNKAVAETAAGRVRTLIATCEARGETLPIKKGALWHAEIKRQAGLTNGQIDGNAGIRAMLQDHAAKHGLAFSRRGEIAPEEETLEAAYDPCEMIPIGRLRDTQLRLSQAERRLAELRAENASLRAQVLRADEVAELIALGGRMAPGGGS